MWEAIGGMFGGGGGGGGYNSTARTGDQGAFGSQHYGGINTGTQGVDITMLAIIAGAVLIAVLVLRK